jgi:hypothetical protein
MSATWSGICRQGGVRAGKPRRRRERGRGQRCWGGGERGKEEVEDVEEGRGEEARSPTSCQRCRTTRPYNRMDSRGGKAQWWSQGVAERDGCLDWGQDGEEISCRRMNMSGRIDRNHDMEENRPQEDDRGWAHQLEP